VGAHRIACERQALALFARASPRIAVSAGCDNAAAAACGAV